MNNWKYIISLIFINLFYSFSSAQLVEKPVIDFVTVSQVDNLPLVYWKMSDPAIINGYGIKRFIRSYPSVPNNTWHTVKLIEDPYVFSYEDNSTVYGSAKPDVQSEVYEITAFKISGSDTVFSLPSDRHKTIYVTGNYNYCLNQTVLTWNNYIGWGSNFGKYEIWCKENNAVFNKIGETTYNDTIFVHTNLNYNSNYTYYVKAIRKDGTESLSNLKLIPSEAILFPTFLNINSASVSADEKFNIIAGIDTNSDTERYILYKSDKLNGNYISVGESLPVGGKLQFIDSLFFPDKLSYYFIAAADYCGNIIFASDTLSNITLSSSVPNKGERINLLKWDDMYHSENYEIYRSTKNTQYTYFDESIDHHFEDNIQPVFEEQFVSEIISGKFCYYVQINDHDFLNRSNISCAEQSETILFPNAFNPKSTIEENRVFKPKAAFLSDYRLTIYGAFGDIIFESENPNIGWDGRLKNGQPAPVSSYLYIARYKNSEGRIVKLKNYVTLVHN